MLEADDATRAAYPSPRTISDEQARLLAHMNSGALPAAPLAVLDASLDLMRLNSTREIDQSARQVKLDALRDDLAAGRTHLVEHEVDDFLLRNSLTAPEGSAERAVLAKQIIRAEIEALERTRERDRGDYGGKPADPAVKPPAPPIDTLVPVNLAKLLEAYVTARTQAGSMKDGGKRSRPVIDNLRKFLGHSDARRVTRKDLLEWRKHLMGPCKLFGKTVDSIYLSLVRSLWSWAVDNEILPENVAATVRQARPKRQRTREAGYTDAEALAVLKATVHYQPKQDSNGRIHEAPKFTSAKRWLPILYAFTGARVAEMTQLRKEDVRQEGDRWVIRVTPDAGTVKAGGYRDVPPHRQVIDLGFITFVEVAKPGHLFHNEADPARSAIVAGRLGSKLGNWLQEAHLVPTGVQPSHGWRHRFKTQAREIGLSDRIADAIQGHAGKTVSDDYGDISLIAKARVIDQLPEYERIND